MSQAGFELIEGLKHFKNERLDMKSFITVSALIAGALFFSGSAGATSVIPPTADELVDDSALVISGVVKSVDVRAFDMESGLPHTRVTMTVDKVFQGVYREAELEMLLLGGINPKNNTVYQVVGTPVFMPGETYLVFLTQGNWQFTPVKGWEYGVFRFVTIDGDRFLVSLSGEQVIDFDSDGAVLGATIVDSTNLRYVRDVMNMNVTRASDFVPARASDRRSVKAEAILQKLSIRIQNRGKKDLERPFSRKPTILAKPTNPLPETKKIRQ